MEMHFFSLQGKYHCADLQNDVILELNNRNVCKNPPVPLGRFAFNIIPRSPVGYT